MVTSDVADCFYQFGAPRWLSRHLAPHPVRAGEPGPDRVDGVPVGASVLVFPLLCVLSMDFSYALHWAQSAHERVLKRAGSHFLRFLGGL